jgi:aminotransferase
MDHSVLERFTRGEEPIAALAQRVRSITVSPIKEMAILAAEVPDAVSLGWGLPDFRTPEHIRRAIAEAALHEPTMGKYSHPKGVLELRQAIASRLLERHGLEIDPNGELLITAGSMAALLASMLAVVEQGDEILLLAPCFSSHQEQVRLAEGVPIFVPLIEDEGWRLDVDAVERAITPRTKALVVCNPANPTGTVFAEADLRQMAELALEHDLFVISDEAYAFLTYDDAGSTPSQPFFSLDQILDLKDNLIGCYSFSKEYAMTGLRVGYVHAPASIIDNVLKVHDAFVICAPTLGQLAVLAALRGPQDCVAQFREGFARRRDLICKRLSQLGDICSFQVPQGAYYVFPRFHGLDFGSIELSLRLLYEAKVVTVPGIAFGPQGEDHLRLSFCGSEEGIDEAFDRIEAWLDTA